MLFTKQYKIQQVEMQLKTTAVVETTAQQQQQHQQQHRQQHQQQPKGHFNFASDDNSIKYFNEDAPFFNQTKINSLVNYTHFKAAKFLNSFTPYPSKLNLTKIADVIMNLQSNVNFHERFINSF